MSPAWSLIGVGQPDASIAEGLFRRRAPADPVLSPRSTSRVRALAERFPVSVADGNREVADRAEHTIPATRPDQVVHAAHARDR